MPKRKNSTCPIFLGHGSGASIPKLDAKVGWLPCRDETSVDMKMYGRRVFTVDHQQYVIDPAKHLEAEKGDMGDPD